MSKFTADLYSKGYGLKTREIPALALLLEQQPCHDRAEIARNLGISTRTLSRYETEQHAPRAIMLALYYESSHGRANSHTAIFNEARAAWQLANGLQAQQSQQSKVLYLLACCSSSAANEALFSSQLDLFAQSWRDVAA